MKPYHLAQHCLSSIGQSDQISSEQNKVETRAGWRELDWSKVAKASLGWALSRSGFGEFGVEFQILATAVAWDCYWLSMRDGLQQSGFLFFYSGLIHSFKWTEFCSNTKFDSRRAKQYKIQQKLK